MAEFRLSAEHQRFAGWARETATEKVAPLARHDGRVNRPLLRAMGELGLLRGLFGGTGDAPRDAAALQLCLLREAIAQVSGEAETALALQGLGSYPILQSGRPELAARWIPGSSRARRWRPSPSPSPGPAPTRRRSRCGPTATATAGG